MYRSQLLTSYLASFICIMELSPCSSSMICEKCLLFSVELMYALLCRAFLQNMVDGTFGL